MSNPPINLSPSLELPSSRYSNTLQSNMVALSKMIDQKTSGEFLQNGIQVYLEFHMLINNIEEGILFDQIIRLSVTDAKNNKLQIILGQIKFIINHFSMFMLLHHVRKLSLLLMWWKTCLKLEIKNMLSIYYNVIKVKLTFCSTPTYLHHHKLIPC